jgi:hypothetical protein
MFTPYGTYHNSIYTEKSVEIVYSFRKKLPFLQRLTFRNGGVKISRAISEKKSRVRNYLAD